MYADEIKDPCATAEEQLEKAWAEIEHLRASLFDMFCEAEEVAVNSYARWCGDGWVFDDSIWGKEDTTGYEKAATARNILGLGAFSYRGKDHPVAPSRELSDKGDGHD